MRKLTSMVWPCWFLPAQFPSNPFNMSNDLRALVSAITRAAVRTTMRVTMPTAIFLSFIRSSGIFFSKFWDASGCVQREIRIAAAEFLAEMSGDQFTVKAAILDENFVRPSSRDDHSRGVDSRNIRLQGFRIAAGAELLRREFDPDAAQEVVIRMVAGECKYKIVLQSNRPGRRSQDYAVG